MTVLIKNKKVNLSYEIIDTYMGGIVLNGSEVKSLKNNNGKLDGLRTDWYENGQKEYEGHYKAGEPDGFWTYWHDNGQKELEGNCKNGEKDGLVTEWSKKGKKIYAGNFKNGKEQ